MNGSRQDAWTKEEDDILAKTVLDYIRNGKTQLDAFKDVAEQLQRTPAACGFRWNANIRKLYEEEIQLAKHERKGSVYQAVAVKHAEGADPLEAAISLLENMKQSCHERNSSAREDLIENLKQENDRLRLQLTQHEKMWERLEHLMSECRQMIPSVSDCADANQSEVK